MRPRQARPASEGVPAARARGPGAVGVAIGIGIGIDVAVGLVPASAGAAEMLTVPAAVFSMGDPSPGMPGEGFADERPVHAVRVSHFYVEELEVTKAMWDNVRDWGLTRGYPDLPAGGAGSAPGSDADERQPVVTVSWYDCVKWCNARSEKERLPPAYYRDAARMTVYRTGEVDLSSAWVDWGCVGYRLPTEAEWERAARAGADGSVYPWPGGGGSYGDHLDGSRANYRGSGDPLDDGATPTGYYDGSQIPAGTHMDNALGLFDMSGNVEEWCWDWFDTDYYSAYPTDSWPADPRGPDAPAAHMCRVARGGSWATGGFELRCSFREPVPPSAREAALGFRCVRGAGVTAGAIIYGLAVIQREGDAVVRWQTACEPATRGFHLYRQQAGAAWEELSPGLIAAKGYPAGGIGASYSCADPGVTPGHSYLYKLVEVETDGTLRTYGPVEQIVHQLALRGIEPLGGGDFILRWASRGGAWYRVLAAPGPAAPFEPSAESIRSTPPENTFTGSWSGPGPVLFRIAEE